MSRIMSCASCSGTALRDLGTIPDGLLLRCESCGSLVLNCRIDSDGELFTDYGAAYREGRDSSKSLQLMRLFRENTLPLEGQPRTLLDIGCGDGEFLNLARQDHWDVCGIDSDPEAIKNAKNLQFRAIKGTLGRSLPDLGHFGVVTLWDVIEHIPNVAAAMKWLSKTVAPGGRLIVLTPNADSVFDSLAHLERTVSLRRSQRLIHLCLNRYHRHRFTRKGLTMLAHRFGFVPERTTTVMLFSLNPEKYLSGFAPGIPGWTRRDKLNGFLSRVSYKTLKILKIKNKILFICRRAVSAKSFDEKGISL